MNEQLWPTEVDVMWLDSPDHPQANMDMDLTLGNEVARGERPALIRIWRAASRPGIGVSKKDVATVQGRAAMAALTAEGVAVVVRQTGGTAVPQGEGVVHVSYLFPRTSQSGTTDAYYRLLCNPLLTWLNESGIVAGTGALPGSYCDGTYNLLVDGQKLIGTAQAWKGGLAGIKSARPGYILAHACMTVDVDLAWSVEQINRFYCMAGDDYRVDLSTATTLRLLNPDKFRGMTAAEATAQVAKELLQFFKLNRPAGFGL